MWQYIYVGGWISMLVDGSGDKVGICRQDRCQTLSVVSNEARPTLFANQALSTNIQSFTLEFFIVLWAFIE